MRVQRLACASSEWLLASKTVPLALYLARSEKRFVGHALQLLLFILYVLKRAIPSKHGTCPLESYLCLADVALVLLRILSESAFKHHLQIEQQQRRGERDQ